MRKAYLWCILDCDGDILYGFKAKSCPKANTILQMQQRGARATLQRMLSDRFDVKMTNKGRIGILQSGDPGGTTDSLEDSVKQQSHEITFTQKSSRAALDYLKQDIVTADESAQCKRDFSPH